MKRRDFLGASATLAGTMFPALGFTQARPCPPGSFGVAGGETTNTACAAGDAEADWIARSTAAGVVWAHDFRHEREITQFRTDSTNSVAWVTDDGVGNGKALQITIPKGLRDGTHWEYYDSASGWEVKDGTQMPQPAVGQSNADWTWITGEQLKAQGRVADGGWWRPFSAIKAGDNGLPNPDRANNGALPLRAWSSASQNYNFRAGYYGHASYHSLDWPGYGGVVQPAASIWDGTDFYIQFRVKLGYWRNGDRGLPATNAAKALQYQRYPAGKLLFIGTTGTTPLHEIVIRSQPIEPRQEITGSRFSAYTGQGYSIDLEQRKTIQGANVTVVQPGGAYDDAASLSKTCYFDGNYAVRNCWFWPVEEWVTVLVHVIPGRQNKAWSGTGATYFDTGLEVWAARAGQTEYVKIIGLGADAVAANRAFPFVFDTSGLHPNAWNSFLPTGYMNNAPSLKAFYHRFTQVIFSKQFIACPQV